MFKKKERFLISYPIYEGGQLSLRSTASISNGLSRSFEEAMANQP